MWLALTGPADGAIVMVIAVRGVTPPPHLSNPGTEPVVRRGVQWSLADDKGGGAACVDPCSGVPTGPQMWGRGGMGMGMDRALSPAPAVRCKLRWR